MNANTTSSKLMIASISNNDNHSILVQFSTLPALKDKTSTQCKERAEVEHKVSQKIVNFACS